MKRAGGFLLIGAAVVGVGVVSLDGLGGDDVVEAADGVGAQTALSVAGGAGADTIVGSEGPDLISGADGDDTIAARATWTGTLAATGRQLKAHIATFSEVRDGRIFRHATYDCYEPF